MIDRIMKSQVSSLSFQTGQRFGTSNSLCVYSHHTETVGFMGSLGEW